jgi:hypothetical protein
MIFRSALWRRMRFEPVSVHGDGQTRDSGAIARGFEFLAAKLVEEVTYSARISEEAVSESADTGADFPIFSLSELELRFLVCVVENPGLPSSAYASLVGTGASSAITVRKQLMARGLIVGRKVATGGRFANLLAVTEHGREIAQVAMPP